VARERQETVIGGHRYQMTMLGATKASHLFVRLLKMIGPSLGGLKNVSFGKSNPGDDTQSILDKDLLDGSMLEIVAALTDRVSEADFDYVVNLLREQCHVGVNGSDKTIPLRDIYELHFAGDLPGILQWLAWGLGVQFGNFRGAFANLIPLGVVGVSQAAAKPSQ